MARQTKWWMVPNGICVVIFVQIGYQLLKHKLETYKYLISDLLKSPEVMIPHLRYLPSTSVTDRVKYCSISLLFALGR